MQLPWPAVVASTLSVVVAVEVMMALPTTPNCFAGVEEATPSEVTFKLEETVDEADDTKPL